ncbi:hypothetical protein MKJ01_05410 [Chryseobacterium sp. SSA4.19]|uniref:hypothetical protein n=1 Tax=Chryseobacterium sp. SSA4.19 TaxID=2919915 RepID=UPI001F4ED9DA|nr:hypothetical protein [Chryseobacterium sp. SSA4.19]MCJ8153198.1 hypothetical protein [Chryseobacterium sp. SSA4.19]
MLKISQPISSQLSTYLREFTTKEDIADVAAEENSCSSSTLRDIVYRTNPVTEKNLLALKRLMSIASKNADAKIKSAKQCKKTVNQMLLDCV